jgi:hypothetical protein
MTTNNRLTRALDLFAIQERRQDIFSQALHSQPDVPASTVMVQHDDGSDLAMMDALSNRANANIMNASNDITQAREKAFAMEQNDAVLQELMGRAYGDSSRVSSDVIDGTAVEIIDDDPLYLQQKP